jgi:hypothetical protein
MATSSQTRSKRVPLGDRTNENETAPVRTDGVSPRKRRATWKASAGAFSLNTAEFGAGLESVGDDLEKRIVQAVAAACRKALQGLQNEITELKESRVKDSEAIQELKSTVKEQKELILRLGTSIEATKAVPLPTPLTYAAVAATQAVTTPVKARTNGPLRER